MKTLLDLLKEIEEKQMNPTDEAKTDVVDEIGTFFVVEKPNPKYKEENTVEHKVFESNMLEFFNQVRGGLKEENIVGFYIKRGDANKAAKEAIEKFESDFEEMKEAMEDFRSAKEEIEKKKASAKEKIQKLKQ
jgi:hypothetical protein